MFLASFESGSMDGPEVHLLPSAPELQCAMRKKSSRKRIPTGHWPERMTKNVGNRDCHGEKLPLMTDNKENRLMLY